MYYSVQQLMLNDRTAKLLFFGFWGGGLFVWFGFWGGFFEGILTHIYLSLKNISYPDPIATLREVAIGEGEGKTFSLILGNST